MRQNSTKIIVMGLLIIMALLIVKTVMVQRQPKESPTVITVKPGSLKSEVKGNVTLACYDHKTNTIYIDPFYIRRSGYTKEQVMAHEMVHFNQWQKHPVWCALNHLLPYQIRPIEKEAQKISST